MTRSRLLLAVWLAACQSGGPPLGAGDTAAGAGDTDIAQPSAYELVFDETVVRDYHLIFTAAHWTLLNDDWTTYVPATVEFGNETFSGVGVRFKGNVSLDYGGFKKSFKLNFDRFNPGQDFHGLDKINLHNGFKDPSLMRENLAYAVHRAAGNIGSRTAHARVYVTAPGTYDREYFGLYINTEAVNKDYLRDRFGNNDGVLYKGGDFRWYGEDQSIYVPDVYEPKTKEEVTDHGPLVHFLDVLNNTPALELEAALPVVFDVDLFIGWLTANTLLADMDGIPGGGGNCYLYHDAPRDKFVLVPWDMNEAFGSTSEGLDLDELITLDIHEPVVWVGASPLIERVLEVPAWRAEYERRLGELVSGHFSSAQMDPSIDTYRDRIAEYVYADTKRHYNDAQFDQSIAEDVPGLPDPPYPLGNMVFGLKRFVGERGASVVGQLP